MSQKYNDFLTTALSISLRPTISLKQITGVPNTKDSKATLISKLP